MQPTSFQACSTSIERPVGQRGLAWSSLAELKVYRSGRTLIIRPPLAPMNARQSSPTLRRECDHFAYSEQPAAHDTEGSAHSLRQALDKEPVVPQVTRHPSVLFAPSALHSFLLRKRQADNALHAYAAAVSLDRP